LKIAHSPSQDLALTNHAYLHPTDYAALFTPIFPYEDDIKENNNMDVSGDSNQRSGYLTYENDSRRNMYLTVHSPKGGRLEGVFIARAHNQVSLGMLSLSRLQRQTIAMAIMENVPVAKLNINSKKLDLPRGKECFFDIAVSPWLDRNYPQVDFSRIKKQFFVHFLDHVLFSNQILVLDYLMEGLILRIQVQRISSKDLNGDLQSQSMGLLESPENVTFRFYLKNELPE